jgi:DNA-binding transcriptional regulator YiaG
MTADDLRAVLGRLSLSQTGAARLLGVDPRTMRRWVLGEREIPEVVVRLLRLLEHVPGTRETLEE